MTYAATLGKEELADIIIGYALEKPDLIRDALLDWKEESFDHPLHRKVWQLVRSRFLDCKPTNLAWLLATQEYSCDELDYLSSCAYSLAGWDNIASEFVKEYKSHIDDAKMRSIVNNPLLTLSEKKEQLLSINCSFDPVAEVDPLDAYYKHFENKIAGLVEPCIKTGFIGLDDAALFQKTNLVVLAAQPGMGKSTFALNIAENVARDEKPVLFISLEMSEFELYDKLVSKIAHIPLHVLVNPKKYQPTASQYQRHLLACEELGHLPIHFKKKAESYNYAEIAHQIRQFKKDNPTCELVVIDYLLLIDVSNSKQTNRAIQIGEITRAFKALAMELDICILALSQLNRTVNESKSKLPELYHLKESSSIGEDANAVIFIHRASVFEKDDPMLKHDADLIIAKGRMSALGNHKLTFNGEYSEFKNR